MLTLAQIPKNRGNICDFWCVCVCTRMCVCVLWYLNHDLELRSANLATAVTLNLGRQMAINEAECGRPRHVNQTNKILKYNPI